MKAVFKSFSVTIWIPPKTFMFLKICNWVDISLDLGLLVLFIFFNIQRFLHEKTGTR